MTKKEKQELLQHLNVLTDALNQVRKRSPRMWGQCKWMQEQVSVEYLFVTGQETLEPEAPSGQPKDPLTTLAIFDSL